VTSNGNVQPGFGPPVDFVDAHIHLWNLTGDICYDWLFGEDGGMLGTQSEIAMKNWDSARFSAETRFHAPAKTVHVQASDPPTDPVDETRWLVEQQKIQGLPTAIVGRVDLRSADVGRVLDDHLSVTATFKGIRDMSTMGALDDTAILAGLAELEKRGLSWEVNTTADQVDELTKIARAIPGLTIVNGHTGWPVDRTPEGFATWSTALGKLAESDNVVCKVSGLGMTDHQWTLDSMSPYVHAALDAFTAERCMFGSNWPVDRIYASYDALVTSVAAMTQGLSASESQAFWSGTATRIYNLD
jgi:predicted TIM-barrel fold metal-dependent hydrolase